MKVNNWFNNNGSYQEGVMLYASLKGSSPNLVRLFLRKESAPNFEKLKYELSKHREKVTGKTISVQLPEPTKKEVITINYTQQNTAPTTPNTKPPTGYFYRLNELDTRLHPLSIKQRDDYQKAISLKLQLNELHDSEEGVALSLCLAIEDLFDGIETTQKVLDHYVQHKVVLNVEPRSYSNYTGGQLADARRNKRTSVAKFKKKVADLKKSLGQNMSKTDKHKTENKYQKAKESLLKHEMELQELNELINTPDK